MDQVLHQLIVVIH